MKKEKQEKQEKSQEKHDLAVKETSGNNEITWSEAEKKIYQLIQSRKRYNEIAKIGFNIRGRGFHRFSISEISRIKKQFNSKPEQTNSVVINQNEEIAYTFQLIQQGLNAVDIITKTKMHPNFVQSCFQKYYELAGYSSTFVKDIFFAVSEWGFECKTEEDLFIKLSEAFESNDFLNDLKFRCSACRDFVYLSPLRNKEHYDDCMEDWSAALRYLSKHNCHYYCA